MIPPIINLDASGRVLGRLASQIALFLQGKHDPHYSARGALLYKVCVKGVNGIRLSGKKESNKLYRWYTGYPGGLKEQPWKEAFRRSPSWVLRHAVLGMLPKNRLRAERMKRLIIEN